MKYFLRFGDDFNGHEVFEGFIDTDIEINNGDKLHVLSILKYMTQDEKKTWGIYNEIIKECSEDWDQTYGIAKSKNLNATEDELFWDIDINCE